MRLLALITDAFGGHGGIAKFNRDLLRAICSHPSCDELVALPRLKGPFEDRLPTNLSFRVEAARGKSRFVREAVRAVRQDTFDGIICGHLNLLPLARVLAWRTGTPLLQIVHGVEAWKRPGSLVAACLPGVNAVVSVSRLTLSRLQSWAYLRSASLHVVPNCIELTNFAAGAPRADLLQRYSLAGRTVLLTLGRLSSTERYKGVDEVLEILPELARQQPDLSYLIVGDGDDRERLEAKALALGLRDRVVFTGYVKESEKADHYRLGHGYVMPGRGEGFGIAYLEAAATGLPVLGSTLDASQEVIRELELGEVVDPGDGSALIRGIERMLRCDRGVVPQTLNKYSPQRFTARWHRVLDAVFRGEESAESAHSLASSDGAGSALALHD